MAFSEDGGDFSSQTIFVDFNQDYTSVSVGTQKGYQYFSLNDMDQFKKTYQAVTSNEIAIVERLYNTGLTAIVYLRDAQKLQVFNTTKRVKITNIPYPDAILTVKLNRSRIVVCLEESLYIHNIRDMKLLHTIKEVPANPKGICALSSYENDQSHLAYPCCSGSGKIQIFETGNLHAKLVIRAHNSKLAALAFNANGSLLASASEKGTVIRVFSVNDGSRIYELRRGLKRCATIYSLAFNVESTLLACASNHKTVHIFKLEENSASGVTDASQSAGENLDSDTNGGWMSFVGQAIISSSSNLFPAAKVLIQDRSFATAILSLSGRPCVVALRTVKDQCRLFVASTSGYLYVYNVDMENGGECSFLRQHNLMDSVHNSNVLTGGGNSISSMSTAAGGKGPNGATPTNAGEGIPFNNYEPSSERLHWTKQQQTMQQQSNHLSDSFEGQDEMYGSSSSFRQLENANSDSQMSYAKVAAGCPSTPKGVEGSVINDEVGDAQVMLTQLLRH